MRKLILVKHSVPKISPAVPAAEWSLSHEGRAHCKLLAESLIAYRPSVVITSKELKAVETGRIIAHALNLPFATTDGLHEHDRRNEPFYDCAETFRKRVREMFEEPSQLVMGNETADAAHERFAVAVRDVLENHPTVNPVIVSHGTVITLLTARANGIEPFSFWKRLGLPSFVVLTLPDFRLLDVIETVVGNG